MRASETGPPRYSCLIRVCQLGAFELKVFIPLTDDMLDQLGQDDRPVPYQAGLSLLSHIRSEKSRKNLSRDEGSTRHLASHAAPPPCRN